MKKIFILIVLLMVGFSSSAWAMTGQELAQSVYDRDDGDDAYFKTEMVLTDRNKNTRQRMMVSYATDAGGLLKTWVEFLEPADIRGTRFLSWENLDQDDTQYLYLRNWGGRGGLSAVKNDCSL